MYAPVMLPQSNDVLGLVVTASKFAREFPIVTMLRHMTLQTVFFVCFIRTQFAFELQSLLPDGLVLMIFVNVPFEIAVGNGRKVTLVTLERLLFGMP